MQLDAYEKLSVNPKVVQCAELANQYKKDVRNLTNLSKTLSQAPPTSFVNLYDVLQSHEISDRSRVDSYATVQITKAVSSFVGKGIYDELDACASKRLTSVRHVQHKIAGCKFQADVSNYITRATVDTATRGTDEHTRRGIKEALLAQLFVAWSSVCVPLIEQERVATQDEAKRCSALLTLVKKTIKAVVGIAAKRRRWGGRGLQNFPQYRDETTTRSSASGWTIGFFRPKWFGCKRHFALRARFRGGFGKAARRFATCSQKTMLDCSDCAKSQRTRQRGMESKSFTPLTTLSTPFVFVHRVTLDGLKRRLVAFTPSTSRPPRSLSHARSR